MMLFTRIRRLSGPASAMGILAVVSCLNACRSRTATYDPDSWQLDYEIQLPPGLLPQQLVVHAVYQYKLSATSLARCGSHTVDSAVLWTCNALLDDENGLRYIAFEPEVGLATVFAIEDDLIKTDLSWSEWQRPDFLESAQDPDSHLLRNGSAETRDYAIPELAIVIRIKKRQLRDTISID